MLAECHRSAITERGHHVPFDSSRQLDRLRYTSQNYDISACRRLDRSNSMWLIKGFDDCWVGYPLEPGGSPQPGPPANTMISVYFTCHRSHQFIHFAESTIANWDATEQLETFACPHCGEIHQTAHGCAYLWLEVSQ